MDIPSCSMRLERQGREIQLRRNEYKNRPSGSLGILCFVDGSLQELK